MLRPSCIQALAVSRNLRRHFITTFHSRHSEMLEQKIDNISEGCYQISFVLHGSLQRLSRTLKWNRAVVKVISSTCLTPPSQDFIFYFCFVPLFDSRSPRGCAETDTHIPDIHTIHSRHVEIRIGTMCTGCLQRD